MEERRRAGIRILEPALLAAVPVPSAGDPGRTIAAYANEWPADLVIVAYDGRARLERALTGCVHERVARFARCAVLVIAADPRARVIRAAGRLSLLPRPVLRGGI